MSCTSSDDHTRTRRYRFANEVSFSDITLHFSGRKFHAHRLMLAAKSDYFDTMFKSAFQDKNQKEIELQEDDADSLETMLLYIYHDGVTDELEIDDQSHRARALKLLTVADKYQVHALKESIINGIAVNLSKGWSKTKVNATIDALQTIDPGILAPYYDVVCKHLGDKYFLSIFRLSKFDNLMEAHPQLAVKVTYLIWQNRKLFNGCGQCSVCDYVWTPQYQIKNWGTIHFCSVCAKKVEFKEWE
ncbi:hypothetical protein KVT40_003652 [Elsinoe batatas]|uniref:BTB domain-containing protein n=1 Tax=Elsinoe batatas TaxID=2601811 RepID=A0A8K0PJI1_9PEZI|nr:hypothetical protein KVT40_003652 [Elsinoe batatas]